MNDMGSQAEEGNSTTAWVESKGKVVVDFGVIAEGLQVTQCAIHRFASMVMPRRHLQHLNAQQHDYHQSG
jgi:hypothetical protein